MTRSSEPMSDYRTVVVGTDGSALAGPTVARAAWIAHHDEADLVVVCAYAEMPRRTEARNIATLGGDTRIGQVLGRAAADAALEAAAEVAQQYEARVSESLLIDGDPAAALIDAAERHGADLLVLGARPDGSVAGRLLGTVSSSVARRAQCDVLLVRPPAGDADAGVPEG